MPKRVRRGHRTAAITFLLCLAFTLVVAATGCKPSAAGPVVPDSDATGSKAGSVTKTGDPSGGASGAPTDHTGLIPQQDGSAPKGPIRLKVYFSLGEKMQPVQREVPYTKAVLTAAMNELLAGPRDAEADAGLSTQIPDGTKLRGISLKDGIATVDLSKAYESGGGTLSMSNRLAQVIFTLTQYPNVQSVSFELDGTPVRVFSGEGLILDHPQTRADCEYSTPAILVDSPAWGASSAGPLNLSGTANVFEGVFQLEVVDGTGRLLGTKTVQAKSGTGTRGTWSTSVVLTPGAGGPCEIRVFTLSAKDGTTRENLVEVPLTLTR